MKQSHDLWTRGCSLMLLLAGFLVSAGAWAGGVAIDSASWDSRYHPNELYIRGSGEDRSEISIYDADSNVLIDKVTASERGSWRYSASNPSSIPCRVRAESRGERDTRSVSNADSFPGGCGTGGGDPGDPGDPGLPKQTDFKMMMNYELGMHCTGFEFAYCCVLPVYNSIIAQIVKPENGEDSFPALLEGDPDAGVTDGGANSDVLGREIVLRDPTALDRNGNFQKYVLRYWHDAQPRVDRGALQGDKRLISQVEGNSLLAWNTVADAADLNDDGSFKLSGAPVHPDDPYCDPDPDADPPGSTCLNTYPLYNGAKGVVLGNGSYTDVDNVFTTPIDNYQNAVWNHLYIYEVSKDGVEGAGGEIGGPAPEGDKIRLGLHLGYPENFGPGGHGMEGLLTYSGEHGTVVYTQMKVLEDLPITLTSPRIWEALGLPLTPFEDTLRFFNDPGDVGEESIRPYVQMKAQMYHYDPNDTSADDGDGVGLGDPVFDGRGNEVIGFGTAPIDIPNCERCHSAPPTAQNSPNSIADGSWALVQQEMNFWKAYYPGLQTGEDWYARLKGAAISILSIHDQEHGTSFMTGGDGPGNDGPDYPAATCSRYKEPIADADLDLEGCGTLVVAENNPGLANPLPQNTRLGHESVICQKCHADNVIAVVKSANCGPGSNPLGREDGCDDGDLILPLTEAIHHNHRNASEGGTIVFNDSHGRSGGCQGCHPAHRSDGVMVEAGPDRYPITLDGDNAFRLADNRDAAGGCFVGRDVHSNPYKDIDGAETPSHLNPVGQWLADNVFSDPSVNGPGGKGIWCTNCHSQAGQELWRAENVADLVHAQPGQDGHVREPVSVDQGGSIDDVVAALNAAINYPNGGLTTAQFTQWLDPKLSNPGDPTALDPSDQTHAIWRLDPGLCDHAGTLFGGDQNPAQDANVAVVELALNDGSQSCSTSVSAPGPDCDKDKKPDFFICGDYDNATDKNFNVHLLAGALTSEDGSGVPCDPKNDSPCFVQSPFCTTPDCVAAAEVTLGGHNSLAKPVPFSAATDGRDHWLAAGEPHCADCHSAPYVEQSGNINAFTPFNYPRKASLMRYSRGHQDITCQGCHESIHGLYPVTPPQFSSTGTAIDSTSYAQAASLNADGSHGPLKCGACHEVGSDQLPRSIDDLEYNGQRIRSINDPLERFDAAVSWAHTFTVEHDPTQDYCVNCHEDESHEVSWREEEWLEHSMKGRVPRKIMDRVELQEQGFISGDPAAQQDPLSTVCQGCHGDESDEISCSGEDGREWKEHLIEGRVSEKVWVYVSKNSRRTGNTTCGW